MVKKHKKRRFWVGGNRHPDQDAFFIEALNPEIWEEGDSKNWDSCWFTGMPDEVVFEQLDGMKSINHIPGNNGLTIKDFLHNSLASARGRLESVSRKSRMDFFPSVYTLPNDYHDWLQHAYDDPDHKWILKPKNSSRGRGIEVVRDLADVPVDNKFMVQDYLDDPHLINDRKYVLRLYVLVSSVEPLRVYLYDEGFAKLASDPYDIDDLDNPFAHLTNPDINALNEDAEAPVVFVNFNEYRKWLREQGHDDVDLFDKVRDLVTLTSLSVRERMRTRTSQINAPTNGCYELMGFDCFINSELKPYILECNLSPDLKVCAAPEDGGEVEYQVKNQLVLDMVSLLGLNLPSEDISKMNIFERSDLELSRSGQFTRLFPAKDTVEDYLSFFPVPRYSDILLAEHVLGRKPEPLKFTPSHTTEIITDDELALYYEKTGTLFKPSELSGWIWLKMADGETPENIAEELLGVHAASHGEPNPDQRWQIHNNVWNVLAEWAQIGMIKLVGNDDHKTESSSKARSDILKTTICAGTQFIELDYGTEILKKYLEPLFAKAPDSAKADIKISLQQTGNGYAVAKDSKLVASNIGLDKIGEVVSRELFEQAVTGQNEIALAGAWVPVSKDQGDFFLSANGSQKDGALSVLYAAETKMGLSGGVTLNLETGAIMPIGLPIRIDDSSTDGSEALKSLTTSGTIQNSSFGGRGRLIVSTLGLDGRDYRLRRLVIEGHNQDDEGLESSSKNTPLHTALVSLITSITGENGEAPTGSQVQKLNDWLISADVEFVNATDIDKAAKGLMS